MSRFKDSIKSMLFGCATKSKICKNIMDIPLKLFYVYIKSKPLFYSDRKFITDAYKKVFKKEPDLDNPKTINEYINHVKLYAPNPLFADCADKYLVREYVKDKIGEEYLIDMYSADDDPYKIDFDALPDSFAIKVNHGSGQNIIVKNKAEMNIEEMRYQLYLWMHRSHYYNYREKHYKYIKPMVISEELMMEEDGSVPIDYKLHAFNGKVEMIQLVTGRFNEVKRIFYTRDWERTEFNWVLVKDDGSPRFPISDPEPRPENLEKMIELAEKLAQDFKYVRVDFYNYKGKILFGELTFTHENGLAKFFPDEWDEHFGKMIQDS